MEYFEEYTNLRLRHFVQFLRTSPFLFDDGQKKIYICDSFLISLSNCSLQRLVVIFVIRSRILVRGAQQRFDPKKGPWAQNLLKIGFFLLKMPENCMI